MRVERCRQQLRMGVELEQPCCAAAGAWGSLARGGRAGGRLQEREGGFRGAA
jgi:hypothetical protein